MCDENLTESLYLETCVENSKQKIFYPSLYGSAMYRSRPIILTSSVARERPTLHRLGY